MEKMNFINQQVKKKKVCICPEAEIKFLNNGTKINKIILEVILNMFFMMCHIAIHK